MSTKLQFLNARDLAQRLMPGSRKPIKLKTGKGWFTCCPVPAHDDKNPSLCVNEGKNGNTVAHCKAGCSQEDVIAALRAKGITLSKDKDRDEVDKSGNLASLKRRGWRITPYDYTDAAGKMIYQNVRAELFNKNGHRIGKTFRQRQPNGKGGWTENLDGIQQVPFRLHELLAKPGQDVHVCEGEKDAGTLAKLGLLSTSIASPEGVDLEVFRDRHVLAHEDNDPAGRSKNLKLAAALHGIATSVRIVRYTDAGDGGDVTDWLNPDHSFGGHSFEDLLTRRDEAPEWIPGPNGSNAGQKSSDANGQSWPDPDLYLVSDDRMPAPAFDWQTVPPGWESWLRGISEDTGAPVDYVFANLLGVASGIIGNARRASPWLGWVEQPHLWVANVGNPSSAKTPALGPFKAAIAELERAELPAHEDEIRRWETRCAVADAELDKWKSDVKDAFKADKPAPDKPASATKPNRPRRPRLIISDATTEEAANLLAHNARGLVLSRSELAGWMGQMDKYGGAGGDRAFYLECYDGGSHTIDRVKHNGEPVRVPFASLTIVATLQPVKLREVFSAKDDGLAARFLYTYPEPIPPHRPQTAGHHQHIAFLQTAFGRLRRLTMNRDAFGGPVPGIIRLDSETALKALEEVRQEIFKANKSETGLIAGWRGKNAGRLLRIAHS